MNNAQTNDSAGRKAKAEEAGRDSYWADEEAFGRENPDWLPIDCSPLGRDDPGGRGWWDYRDAMRALVDEGVTDPTDADVDHWHAGYMDKVRGAETERRYNEKEAQEEAVAVLRGADMDLRWSDAGFDSAEEAARCLVDSGPPKEIRTRAIEIVAEEIA